MTLLLGCIADDFTGATDLASTLVKGGMRTVQLIGVPDSPLDIGDAQALVIALKSRTIPADEAVRQSLAALTWLKGQGARQILFKYCSTFDSTDDGNIGPVSEALMAALKTDFTIACPAFPENGRTVYQGHLFVGDQLISESSMRHHPLTPMTDSDLVALLGRQSRGKVGLLPLSVVERGADAIRDAITELRANGVRQAIADAVAARHLIALGHGADDLKLITGGSGIAMGLPDNFRDSGLLGAPGRADRLPVVDGTAVVLAGSCSAATRAQIEHFQGPFHRIDVAALCRGEDEVERAMRFAEAKLGAVPILISASASPEEVAKVQAEFGRARAGSVAEQALAAIATALRAKGARRFVLAGGETSGAVVSALGVRGLRIGAAIDPGVPWTTSLDDDPVALALKSGNFGTVDFFNKAFRCLDELAVAA
ncbi:MAG: four-carbon acid sugar kinase family protein [Alphaproteobacteria bacterium]|nr:four-carbon acid sugar kinase family protein [Alphaproteobacteria bacterium]